MARLFDADPADFTRVSIPICKFEEGDDGAVFVYGKATDGTLDRDEQIIDPDFAAKSLRQWFETGANVRVMHSASLYPAGRGVELLSGDDGQWLKSKVVEPVAAKLVKEGVLTAYSVGIARPQIVRDSIAKGGRVVGGETVEVSLVDRPANPSCGVVLAKMAGGSVELVSELVGDVPKASGGRIPGPAELAASLVKFGHATGAVTADGVKRDMDPDVGGGVDRDKLGAGDFVFGDERVFPVVTPGDVSDAVSSWGRYKGSKTFEEFKAKLTALARRKGQEFVDELPKEWTKQGEKADGPDLTKGAKDCTNCGKDHDADTDAKFCAGCGHKLPAAKAEKTVEPEAAKAAETDPDEEVDGKLDDLKDAVREAVGAQAKDPDAHEDPNDAKVSAHLEAAEAAVNAAQSAQTKDMAEESEDVAEKAEKAATAGSGEAPGLTPVEGMGYGLRRLHDATCAAYSWLAVKAAHPGLDGGLAPVVTGAGDLLHFALKDALAADGLTAEGAQRLAGLSKAYAAACELDGADEASIAEARAELVKAFRGAYPDAPALTPLGPGKDPDPARFRRPYISSGHATQSAAPGQRPRIPDASHVPNASQFDRALITAGHQADSPANSGGGTRPVVTSASTPHPQTRTAPGEELSKAFRGGAGGRALEVMKAVHDHLADSFPDCCPMAPASFEESYAASAATPASPAPTPVVAKAAGVPDLAKAAAANPDLFKAAVAAVIAEQVEVMRTDYETKIADLAAAHEGAIADMNTKFAELARQPDPAQAPFRGMAGLEQLLLGKRAPEPPAGAEAARAEYYREWLDSNDPAQREAARDLLRGLSARP